MKRLHIVGCHRSGTTLLFELVTTCIKHDEHCQHERSIFKDKTICNGLYISKKPSDITHIQKIFLRDPDLHIIYLLRDPRSVVTSIHPSKSDRYFSSFERWLRYEAAAAPLKSHPRFFQINYEALVSLPDDVQANLCQQFPFLEQSHLFSEFAEYAQTSKEAQISLKGLRPVSKANVENWRQHLPRLSFQLERYPVLAEKLIEYGYEQNKDWLHVLEGISPRSQVYGEKPASLWKQKETNLRYWIMSLSYLSRKT
ncbi:MAG: sulfotransferase [Pseudomonadales bacterium]